MTRACFNLYLNLSLRFSFSRRVHSQGRVNEGVVEENQPVPGEADKTKAIKKAPEDASCKRKSGFEEQAAELESDNPTSAFQNVPDRQIQDQHPSTSADLHVVASHQLVNLESARNIDEEKPRTSEKPERNEVERDSGDDVVVLASQSVPEEGKEDDATTGRSDETHGDGPVQQDKIDKDVDGNVVVV